jgi:photosystem II stability/assembly factor-like uncharacterized protein
MRQWLASLCRARSVVALTIILASGWAVFGQGTGRPRTKQPGASARASLAAPPPLRFNDQWLSTLKWRSIGPANMGGRIVDLAVVESDPSTYYLATASGGLFKTVNNGTTFAPVFDRESTVSIGDVCVAPSKPEIVWVGTGEHNARNSVSWGDGVYKSVDGGRSWRPMGLKQSFQIGRIVIHPQNPDVVYIGALGRLWGPNEERGVFKTTDGGKSWSKVLYVDDKTGCIDLVMHPTQPDTILAAMYERQRDEFDSNDPAKRWGKGSGLYKTTDGGKTWRRLDSGLPTVQMGRIGVTYYRKNPNVVLAIIETEKIGTGPGTGAYMGMSGNPRGTGGAVLEQVIDNGPAAKAGLKQGDRVTKFGGVEIKVYDELIAELRKRKPDEKVKVTARRGEETVEVELTLGQRSTGGAAGTPSPFAASLGGQQPNVHEKQGTDGYQTGGIYKSTDGGDTWQRINSLNPRPFYYSQIHVDPSDENHVYVLGIQFFHSADGGKRFRSDAGSGVHPDHHALWINPRDGRHLILGCDGGLFISHDRTRTWDFLNVMALGQFYHVAVDNRPMYRVYGGLQDNGSWGGPSLTRGRGPSNESWYRVGGADGFVCAVDRENPDIVYYESQWGGFARVNIRTGERASIAPRITEGQGYRFHWKAPFILSHHNTKIYYCAGNYVFRSLNQGSDLKIISKEISRTNRGSATALAESPRDSNVLYVGTDDGNLWVTRDGGQEWTNIAKNVGLPGPRHVATIEVSKYSAGRAYVAFDGHRSNDNAALLYVTEDYGKTWRALNANLPEGSTRCLREDAVNENLLYTGTEFGIFCSLDRGRSWVKFNNNLPTVAVHEIAVHPTAGEIVAGTHGRSIWVMDVTPLRQLTRDVRGELAHLFQPDAAIRWAGALREAWNGHRSFEGENKARGARLHYFLGREAKNVALKITDMKGATIRELKAEKTAGLHAAAWDLRREAPATSPPPKDGPRPKGKQGSGRRGGAQPPGVGPPVPPGIYQVALTVDGHTITRDLTIEADPEFPNALLTEELEYMESQHSPVEIE